MSDRAYTVAEIDALRVACAQRWVWGTTVTPYGISMSRPYRAEEKDAGTEQLVRTYMLAGIVAADIYAEDMRRAEEQAAYKASFKKPEPPAAAIVTPDARRAKFNADLETAQAKRSK